MICGEFFLDIIFCCELTSCQRLSAGIGTGTGPESRSNPGDLIFLKMIFLIRLCQQLYFDVSLALFSKKRPSLGRNKIALKNGRNPSFEKSIPVPGFGLKINADPWL